MTTGNFEDRIDAVLSTHKDAIEQLQEGQSRFMNDLFTIVNECNARVRGLEQRVQWLEVAMRGLMSGAAPRQEYIGDPYDARSSGTHSVNPGTVGPSRNTGSPED